MLILAAFNCLSWWRISSKESLHSYQSQWSHLPGKLFILMCLFEVFIRMATPPPPSWVLFLLPSTYFHVVTDLLSHFPLWLFKESSPNFLNLFLLPSHTTSLFLSRHLHFCLPSSPLTAASSEPCWTLRGTAFAACCGVYRHRVYRKEWNTDRALGTSMNRIWVSAKHTSLPVLPPRQPPWARAELGWSYDS